MKASVEETATLPLSVGLSALSSCSLLSSSATMPKSKMIHLNLYLFLEKR